MRWLLLLAACASAPSPKRPMPAAMCSEHELRQFAARFGVGHVAFRIEPDSFAPPDERSVVMRCLPEEADPFCGARAHALPPPPGYVVAAVYLQNFESHRAAIVVMRAVPNRRHAEFAWTREGLTRLGDERTTARRLAAEAKMKITINNLTHGLLIRATCDRRD
jgi:hypothetical protein